MDLGFDFFNVDNKKLSLAKGRVLIAEPFLDDTYFKRSIIFLTEHSEEGSVGFVLNKPVSMNLNEIVQDISSFQTMISVGGPVGTNSVHYIHTIGDIVPNSIDVYDGISWGGDFDVIKQLIKKGKIKQNEIRFFLGYSGWHPSQLERELTENSWVVTNVNKSIIMNTSTDDLWKKTVKNLGKRYELWSNFPENPSLN